MTTAMNGQWVDSSGTATPQSSIWQNPEIAPRVGTTTVNPLLAIAFTAMLAVSTAVNVGNTPLPYPQLIGSAGISLHGVQAGAWTEVDTSQGAVTEEVAPVLIEELRSDFRLSDSSIAQIFNVSRQTVYNWRTGKTATGFPERLAALTEALRQVKTEDAQYLHRVLFYPTTDGRLIQDALSDEAWGREGAAGVYGMVAELAGKAQQLRDRDLKTIARLEKSGGSNLV
jgi:hypothetical protein